MLRSWPSVLRRWVAPVVGYAAVSVGPTWPLAANLSSRLPLGAEPTATVPQFNLWTMQWNGDRIARAFSGYWNAPIFHPTRGAFAVSDPQPLSGVLAAGLHLVAGDDVAVYSLVLMVALVLNGLGAMVLASRLGVPRGAAWLAGVLALSMPFVYHELGVLQLVMVFPFFFALVAREHGHPMVNGYSGFFPTQCFDLQAEMQGFPERGVASLRVRGVRWVVIDRSWLSPDLRDEVASSPDLTRAYADRRVVVYRLSASTGVGE